MDNPECRLRARDIEYSTGLQRRLPPAETPTYDTKRYHATCEEYPEELEELPSTWMNDNKPVVVDTPTTTSAPPQSLKPILKKVTPTVEEDRQGQKGQEIDARNRDPRKYLSAEADKPRRRAAEPRPVAQQAAETEQKGWRRRPSETSNGRRMPVTTAQEKDSRKDAEAVYDDDILDDKDYVEHRHKEREHSHFRREINHERQGQRDKASSSGIVRRGEDQAHDGKEDKWLNRQSAIVHNSRKRLGSGKDTKRENASNRDRNENLVYATVAAGVAAYILLTK